MIFQSKFQVALQGLCLFCAFTHQANLLAEDLPRPDRFFEQNYSETILEEAPPTQVNEKENFLNRDRENSEELPSAIISQDEVLAPAHKPEITDRIPPEEPETLVADSAAEEDPLKSEDGLEVPYISFIVASEPKEHLHQNIEAYSQTLEYYGSKPANLHIIGPLAIGLDFPSVWIRLMARGVAVETDHSVLETLGVTRSPTWILHSKSGDIIVEGEPGLENYLNSEGKFRKELLEKTINKGNKR